MISTLPLLYLRQARARFQPCVQLVAPRLGRVRRVALELADHGLRRGLPFGGDLRRGGRPCAQQRDEEKCDEDFHDELSQ